MANTTNLLLSAKSTRARIISCPVLFADAPAQPCSTAAVLNVRHEPYSRGRTFASVTERARGPRPSVRDHLLPWLEPRLDLLQIRVVRQQISADHFHAAKLLVGRGNEDEIAIVHVQDGGRRDDGVHLLGLTAEGGPHEHAQPHDSGILHFNSNLGGADIGIENRANVADLPLEHAIGIGIQADLRRIAEPDVGQVVLVHVADNPDGRQIGNRERVRSIEGLHGCGVGDLLIGNHSRDGREDIHHARAACQDRCRAAADARPWFPGRLWPCLRCPAPLADRSARWRRARTDPWRVPVERAPEPHRRPPSGSRKSRPTTSSLRMVSSN